MPPTKREQFTFPFRHKGEQYYFDSYVILKDGEYVCNCDLTCTVYYGDELVTLLCCRAALDAYYAGKADGKIEHKQEVRAALNDLFGL